jgi:hypothetical protein
MWCHMSELRERLRDRYRYRLRTVNNYIHSIPVFTSVCLENAFQSQDDHLMAAGIYPFAWIERTSTPSGRDFAL